MEESKRGIPSETPGEKEPSGFGGRRAVTNLNVKPLAFNPTDLEQRAYITDRSSRNYIHDLPASRWDDSDDNEKDRPDQAREDGNKNNGPTLGNDYVVGPLAEAA